jgi:hypothetical protein
MARRAKERNEIVGGLNPATHDARKATNVNDRTAHAS